MDEFLCVLDEYAALHGGGNDRDEEVYADEWEE